MLQFLSGGGQMAEAINAHDWSSSPLGPTADWDDVLKTTVSMILNARFPMCLMWGAERITIANDAFLPILGVKGTGLGVPFRALWPEVLEYIEPLADRAFAGEATFIEDCPLTIERGGGAEQAWFTFCYSPLRDAHGRVVGVLDTVVETTAKVHAERMARIIAEELAHRIKNSFAVLQAIASQTFRGDAATPEARKSFEARIAAMARAQDLILQENWDYADIAIVIAEALRPFQDDLSRFDIAGPAVTIRDRQALSLALGIHELASNAAKYGALSVPGGTVTITWEAGTHGSDDPFVLRWEEQGGPVPAVRSRTGFGARLIERVMPAEFHGQSIVEWPLTGLRFTLTTKMAHLIEPDILRQAIIPA